MSETDTEKRCAEIFLRALNKELADNPQLAAVIEPLFKEQPLDEATPQEFVEVIGQKCEVDSAFSEQLETALNARVTDPKERTLMGIPPRSK